MPTVSNGGGKISIKFYNAPHKIVKVSFTVKECKDQFSLFVAKIRNAKNYGHFAQYVNVKVSKGLGASLKH